MSRQSVPDLPLHLHLFTFYLKDIVMLQSALRGHLLRESQLKELLKDTHNKVSLTYKHLHTVSLYLQSSKDPVKHQNRVLGHCNKEICYYFWYT